MVNWTRQQAQSDADSAEIALADLQMAVWDLAPESTPWTMRPACTWRARSGALSRATGCVVPRESLARSTDPLGPNAAACVSGLADLGLSAEEIARYHGVGIDRIVRLMRVNEC